MGFGEHRLKMVDAEQLRNDYPHVLKGIGFGNRRILDRISQARAAVLRPAFEYFEQRPGLALAGLGKLSTRANDPVISVYQSLAIKEGRNLEYSHDETVGHFQTLLLQILPANLRNDKFVYSGIVDGIFTYHKISPFLFSLAAFADKPESRDEYTTNVIGTYLPLKGVAIENKPIKVEEVINWDKKFKLIDKISGKLRTYPYAASFFEVADGNVERADFYWSSNPWDYRPEHDFFAQMSYVRSMAQMTAMGILDPGSLINDSFFKAQLLMVDHMVSLVNNGSWLRPGYIRDQTESQ